MHEENLAGGGGRRRQVNHKVNWVNWVSTMGWASSHRLWLATVKMGCAGRGSGGSAKARWAVRRPFCGQHGRQRVLVDQCKQT